MFLDFEGLPDAYFFSAGGQNIGNYYSGLTFGPYVTGLSVSRFGGYDDSGFPPHSGDVVVWSAFDDPMTISFDSAASDVSFWYTSLNPISLTAYDGSGDVLGSVDGDANTDGSTGTSSLLEFEGAGIASVAISSEAGQYVIDDLAVSTEVSSMPEPGTGVLLATAFTMLGALETKDASHSSRPLVAGARFSAAYQGT